ncbi:MAG TPA: circadian clock KaiB family protein [Candidatus Polarisedimenticolia bacterium]|nr:circadian clock KaiB family protein [Candidatus Polarisedimenticolia bacterium]
MPDPEAAPRAVPAPGAAHYDLSLYVTGATPRSARAIANLTRLCERYLPGRFALKVVDLYQQPELAAVAQIVAAPTLVKRQPLPVRRIIGDMSDTQRVLDGLQLTASGSGS